MKRIILSLGAFMLCVLPALAQDYPKAEINLSYEYIRFSPALEGNKNVSFNGGGGSVTYNVNHLLGLKAEFTGAQTGDTGLCSQNGINCLTRGGNFFTYLFGPQVNFRGHSRVIPYVHLLFGGAHSNVFANLSQAGSIPAAPSFQEGTKEAFALAVGGGLDVKASSHISIRVGQFDYFMTRFSGREVNTAGSGSVGNLQISNQSSFRYMAGINFLIGSKSR
jgi:opacity protein-like surface antigen